MSNLIFRAISKEYLHLPFVPSAMYPHNIKTLEERINGNFSYQYPKGCKIAGIHISRIQDLKYHLDFRQLQNFNTNYNSINIQEVMYAFLLSRINIIMGCSRNRDYELLTQSISLHWFTPCKEDINETGFCRYRLDKIIEDTVYYLKEFPKIFNENGYLKIERTWFDFSLFQHLNYIYDVPWLKHSTLNSIYPTMCMDWTSSKKIIEDYQFGGTNKIIVHMDMDKYISEFQFILNRDHFINAYVFGVASPIDIKDNATLCFQNSNNNLMISQKALTIFWPWQHTIEEMINSTIGKKLGFNLSSS